MFTIDMDAQSMRTFKALQNSAYLIRTIEQGINRGWIDMGRALVRKGRDSIKNDAKTGEIYRVPTNMRGRVGKSYHQASNRSGSETPANYTGELMRGLHYVSHYTQLEWGYDASTPYGKYLEEGSPGGKIKKRPLLTRFSNEFAGDAETYMSTEIQHQFLRKF